MIIQPTDLTEWLADIRNANMAFSFSRWGDGEWRSVLAKGTGANCDGHAFFSGMGRQLSQILASKPKYRLGMQNFSLRLYGKSIENHLTRYNLQDLIWYNADVFHHGAINGKLAEIVDAVASRQVLLVGPAHLKDLRSKGLPFWKHIAIPGKDVFLHLKTIREKIVTALREVKKPILISLSAGMPAEILLDWLYKDYGKQHTTIDFGSLWDPLVGVKSRSYMRHKR